MIDRTREDIKQDEREKRLEEENTRLDARVAAEAERVTALEAAEREKARALAHPRPPLTVEERLEALEHLLDLKDLLGPIKNFFQHSRTTQ
jgi:hypothetical protein